MSATGWVQLSLPGVLLDLYSDPAATLLAGCRPGECELCGGTDEPDTLVPAEHVACGGLLVQAHPECAAARGYGPVTGSRP